MKTKRSICFRNVSAFLVLLLALTATAYTQPQFYNYNTLVGNNVFPFGVNPTAGKSTQTLYLPGAFSQPTSAPAGNITRLYVQTVGSVNVTYTQLTIKMALTTDTDLPTGAWFTPLVTVFDQSNYNMVTTAGQFVGITLTTPFNYDPTRSLVVEITQCGYSGTGFGVHNTTLSGTKRHAGPLAVLPCPHIWGNSSGITTHTGIDVAPAPLINRALLLPNPGVNTNYVAIPHQAGMIGFTNLTIEAWVKPAGTTTAATILNKGAISFDYQLGISATTMIPFVRLQGVVATATGFTVTAGIWTHIAATFDGSNVRFYKDGALVSTVPLAGSPGSSSNEMRIGRGNADPGNGNIEELRLWTVARTQGAIDSNRCRKFPSQFSSTTGLRALWHFDSTYIDSISSFNGTPMGTVGFDTVSFPVPGANCNLVGIVPVGNIIPNTFSLNQNYPNPFNPSTSIKFSIPKGGFVELKIYDILGREIMALVNDPFEAGTYEVTFEASKLASGVYFYTLVSGDFKDTKKMLLIK